MKIAFFDAHQFDQQAFENENQEFSHQIVFFKTRLNSQTANLSKGFDVVCSFVNDRIDQKCVEILNENRISMIALRCAGFNHVDLEACKEKQIAVVRVPAYSPYAVAEYTMALLLTLNRKIHKAYNRVREANFSIDGLVGFDLHQKTVGVLGTGKIGSVFCDILKGFGCRILAYDLYPSLNLEYVNKDKLFQESDIISLHLPLKQDSFHILDQAAFSQMKQGVFILNTSRGALIDTKALIQNLKSGRIGGAALDVYEEEEEYFFQDHSDQILQDDDLLRLTSFPNVIISSHQAFLTREALKSIASTTLQSISDFESKKQLTHQI